MQTILDAETALDQPDHCLATLTLTKSAGSDEDDGWRFSGIASDESEDAEGDKILRKALDVSYASSRGYVNWDHSREPSAQIGYLTKCEIIQPGQEGEYAHLGKVARSATVYVEGMLFKHVPRAIEVHQIMKSMPKGMGGLGLSLDGKVARDARSGGIVKAYVRGVAITPVPAQPKTMLQLRKSLMAYQLMSEAGLPTDQIANLVADQVVERLTTKLQKNTESGFLSHDQAILWVLKTRPKWSYELADKLVRYTIQTKSKGAQ